MKPHTKLIILLSVLAIGVVLLFFTGSISDKIFTESGPSAMVLFFLLVVFEVIFAPIPGGALGFLAAAAWGPLTSIPLHYAANVCGSIIVFMLARMLGKPFVDDHVSESAQQKANKWLSTNPWVLFLIYAIPVFPIDTISLLLGVTSLKTRTFLLITIPGLLVYTIIVGLLGWIIGPYIPWLQYFGQAVTVLVIILVVWAVFKYVLSKD